jgi:hypothetical protein
MLISSRSLFVIAAVSLLGVGALSIVNTRNFLARTVSAEGVVRQRAAKTLWVGIEPDGGSYIVVRRPFSWPGAYLPGTRVRIVYRPDQVERPWVSPLDFLFPSSGRVATWRGIWFGPVVVTSVGALLLALCILAFAFPRGFRVGLRFNAP